MGIGPASGSLNGGYYFLLSWKMLQQLLNADIFAHAM